MGATLEIQRQQRMDLLDQQMLLAQYSQARRTPRQQPQVGGPHATAHPAAAVLFTSLTFCVAWLAALEQILPVPETPRADRAAAAAPPPGPEPRGHAAPAAGGRGAGRAACPPFSLTWLAALAPVHVRRCTVPVGGPTC